MEKLESIKVDFYSLINTVESTRTYVQGKPKTEIFLLLLCIPLMGVLWPLSPHPPIVRGRRRAEMFLFGVGNLLYFSSCFYCGNWIGFIVFEMTRHPTTVFTVRKKICYQKKNKTTRTDKLNYVHCSMIKSLRCSPHATRSSYHGYMCRVPFTTGWFLDCRGGWFGGFLAGQHNAH